MLGSTLLLEPLVSDLHLLSSTVKNLVSGLQSGRTHHESERHNVMGGSVLAFSLCALLVAAFLTFECIDKQCEKESIELIQMITF